MRIKWFTRRQTAYFWFRFSYFYRIHHHNKIYKKKCIFLYRALNKMIFNDILAHGAIYFKRFNFLFLFLVFYCSKIDTLTGLRLGNIWAVSTCFQNIIINLFRVLQVSLALTEHLSYITTWMFIIPLTSSILMCDQELRLIFVLVCAVIYKFIDA